ncbi:hypothetical protein BGX38DRAFT_1180905, partial [Terfezia claveryi]
MDVHALKTIELDETSISRSAEIIEALLKDARLMGQDLNERIVLHAGDLGTMLKVGTLRCNIREIAGRGIGVCWIWL